MKIGFSLSACVMDIYEGKVDIDDVFLIQSGTNVPDLTIEAVTKLVNSYRWDGRMWGDLEEVSDLTLRLLLSGKIYQPLVAGFRAIPINFKEHWADLAPTILSEDENVVAAWKQYQMILRLSEANKPVMPAHLQPRVKLEEPNVPKPPFNDDF